MNVDEEKKMRGWRDTKTNSKKELFFLYAFQKGGGGSGLAPTFCS